MPSGPSLKSVEALCSAAMKQQLHDTLVNLASSTFKRYILMPADFAAHYNLARSALSASSASGDPLGWLIWQQLADHPQKLDCAIRRLAVATAIDGRVLPRTDKRRRLKPRQPLPALFQTISDPKPLHNKTYPRMLQLADLVRRSRVREVERAVSAVFDDHGVFKEDALSLDDALTARTPEMFAGGQGVHHDQH